MEKYEKIKNWMKPDPPTNLFTYRPRKNNASLKTNYKYKKVLFAI